MRSLIATLTIMGMFLTSSALAVNGSVEVEVDAESLLGDKLTLEVSGADFATLVGSGVLQSAGGGAIPLIIDSSEISAGDKGKVRIQLVDNSGAFIVVISLSGGIKVTVKDIPSEVKLADFRLDRDELEVEIEIE